MGKDMGKFHIYMAFSFVFIRVTRSGGKNMLYCYILFDSLICLWCLQIDWSV